MVCFCQNCRIADENSRYVVHRKGKPLPLAAMRKVILLLCLLPLLCDAQEDIKDLAVFMASSENIRVFLRPDTASPKVGLIPKEVAIVAVSFLDSSSGVAGPMGFWHIVCKGIKGYVPDDRSKLYYKDEDAISFRNRGIADDSERFVRAVALESEVRRQETSKTKARAKNGVAITMWDWAYENEYSMAAYVHFNIENCSKKRIKYITAFVSAFNAVDDHLTSFGKPIVQLKAIGPIEPGDWASFTFETAFWSKVIATMKIDKIVIQYFDGTIKTLGAPRDWDES
jgi:hypothetical protein